MKLDSKLFFQLGLTSAAATVGLLIGISVVNPSGFNKYLQVALGSAATVGITAYGLRVATDRSATMKLEIKRLESRILELNRKLDKEYADKELTTSAALELGNKVTALESDLSLQVSSNATLIKSLEDWKLAANEAHKGCHVLTAQMKALETEHQKALEAAEKKFRGDVHKAAKNRSIEVTKRQYANYERDIEKQAASLTENFNIELGKLQSRISELNAEIEGLTDEIEGLKDENLTAGRALEHISQEGIPGAIAQFESEWNANDDRLQQALEQLQQANSKMAAPRLFQGETAIDSIGNRIISHFYSYGVVMDAIEAVASKNGFNVRFKVDRNGSGVKLTEEEFDKRIGEAGLLGLSHEPLDFKLDARNFIVSVEISTGLKTAKSKAGSESAATGEMSEQAKKFPCLKPASDFTALAKTLLFDNKIPSLRINGGSGSGKSSICRLLLSEGYKEKGFKILLHDPQDGSSEDRWKIAKESKNVSEATEAIIDLKNAIEAKNNPVKPVIDVFDEIDGMTRSNSDVKAAYLTIATQVRHLENQFLIVIGQSPSASRNGLMWSDFDSIGCMYISDSAIQAISHSPKLKSQSKKLASQYDELLEESAESELIDPVNFFRFALVVLPGKPPFWMELPAFSDGIVGYGSQMDVRPSLDKTSENLAIKEFQTVHKTGQDMDSAVQAPKNLTATILKCPSCSSENIGSKGDRNRCKDCGKTWKK